MIKLKSVRVIHPVPYDTQADITLTMDKGSLEYDEESGLIVATPKNPKAGVKALGIPLANVQFFAILDEAGQKKYEADRKAAIKEAESQTPRTIPSDVITFVKK